MYLNLQENTCNGVSFLIKLQAAGVKNTFFTDHHGRVLLYMFFQKSSFYNFTDDNTVFSAETTIEAVTETLEKYSETSFIFFSQKQNGR